MLKPEIELELIVSKAAVHSTGRPRARSILYSMLSRLLRLLVRKESHLLRHLNCVMQPMNNSSTLCEFVSGWYLSKNNLLILQR